MPLSKVRMRERKRLDRANVKPSIQLVKPNRYLSAHIKAYPEGFNPDGTYRKDYNPDEDPYINPLIRKGVQPKLEYPKEFS